MTLKCVEKSTVVQCPRRNEVDAGPHIGGVGLLNRSLDNWMDDKMGLGDFDILLEMEERELKFRKLFFLRSVYLFTKIQSP